jgi:hypothetical protein
MAQGWSLGVAVVVLVGAGATGHGMLTQEEASSIFACYHDGRIIVEAPKVEDFVLRQQGMMLEARWTNPTSREEEVLVTTLPCVYRVTNPPASIPAN